MTFVGCRSKFLGLDLQEPTRPRTRGLRVGPGGPPWQGLRTPARRVIHSDPSRTQQRWRDHADAVGAAVGVGPGIDDDRVMQVGAEVVGQPTQVRSICCIRCSINPTLKPLPPNTTGSSTHWPTSAPRPPNTSRRRGWTSWRSPRSPSRSGARSGPTIPGTTQQGDPPAHATVVSVVVRIVVNGDAEHRVSDPSRTSTCLSHLDHDSTTLALTPSCEEVPP